MLNKLTAVLGLGLELVWIFSVQGLEIFAGSGPIQPEVFVALVRFCPKYTIVLEFSSPGSVPYY